MKEISNPAKILGNSLELPCGAILKNRFVKAPMSDSLGNGEGDPTENLIRLYERWAEGGTALSIIGEVQWNPCFPEKPGNLVLGPKMDNSLLWQLTQRATVKSSHLWPQLGHAGALSYLPLSSPKGPSAISIDDFSCDGISGDEMRELPLQYAKAAEQAKSVGFTGVQIHAAHGFLLSQFLSPLFNHRTDRYGGSIEARCQIVTEVIHEVRRAVGPTFPLGIKMNSTDKLEGGLTEDDALTVVQILDETSIDLIDVSGGTYFPGAKASSDGSGSGPYFLDFAEKAKEITTIPLTVTGGFKTRQQAVDAVGGGAADMVGVARAMVLDPQLPKTWLEGAGTDPAFPRFEAAPPGGITAWYTMRLSALAEDREDLFELDLPSALEVYEKRDAERCLRWRKKFF